MTAALLLALLLAGPQEAPPAPTSTNVITVAIRVASPIVIANAARAAIQSSVTYSARGNSGYQDAYGS